VKGRSPSLQFSCPRTAAIALNSLTTILPSSLAPVRPTLPNSYPQASLAPHSLTVISFRSNFNPVLFRARLPPLPRRAEAFNPKWTCCIVILSSSSRYPPTFFTSPRVLFPAARPMVFIFPKVFTFFIRSPFFPPNNFAFSVPPVYHSIVPSSLPYYVPPHLFPFTFGGVCLTFFLQAHLLTRHIGLNGIYSTRVQRP